MTGLKNFTICVGILLVCTSIGYLFYHVGLSEANIITIYIIGILAISSLTSSRVYGIISSIAGVLLFNCLYAIPRFTLFFFDTQYTITAVIMLIASLSVSYMTSIFRNQLAREKKEARRSTTLSKLSHSLQNADCENDFYYIAAQQVSILLSCEAELLQFDDDSFDNISKIKNLDHKAFIQWAKKSYDENQQEPFYNTGKIVKNIYYKIQTPKKTYAFVKVITDDSDLITPFDNELIITILGEVALATEKYILQEMNDRALQEAANERFRSDILRTFSHDLRTPLTSIYGNSDILIHGNDKIDINTRRDIYKTIHSDAEWLINIVENLLFFSSMGDSNISLKLESEILQEVVSEAVKLFTSRNNSRQIDLTMEEEFMIVSIDIRLFIHVITNLIDNAIKYTPHDSSITISVMMNDYQAVIEVADTGYGISDEEKLKVFEVFYTQKSKVNIGRQGIGIGLSLCKSIVDAHNGEIYIRDNEPQGAIVGFTVPLINQEYARKENLDES